MLRAMTDSESTTPSPGETALIKVLRRIEEDGQSAHAVMVSTIHAHPDQLHQTVMQYLVELFEISAHWHNFLVSDYEAVDGWYKPHLDTLTAQVVSYGEQLIANWNALEKTTFIRTLKSHLAGKQSHWRSQALKRAREFGAQKPPSEHGTEQDSTKTAEGVTPPVSAPQARPRRIREPNPQLLDKGETLNRKQAAEALGVTERTLDRWVGDLKLTPIGGGGHRRFKTKDLRKFLNQKSQDN
jgi:excisionase family DNA binding protein